MEEGGEGGEGCLAAGDDGVLVAGCFPGCSLREEGGLFVGADVFFLLGFEVFGVLLVVNGVFWSGIGSFDVVGAVQEFGA